MATRPQESSSSHGGRPPLPTPAEIAALPPDGGPEFNRLIFTHSPYLLQHARNPVDWYPWGDEAFERARREDRPIFLSIGYSTCHWCHVMEAESFENQQVADLLNAHFVAIKVDREERPDVDSIYMQVTIAMTGSGGWPMTVVMTPDGKPFFAGTYFPRVGRFGQPGLIDVLAQLAQAWETRRGDITQAAQQLADYLQQVSGGAPGSDLGADVLDAARRQLGQRFDDQHGGFGGAPKFPTPHNLLFLLREWRRTGDAHALEMVETTLRAMRRGGVFDQVGFGFHRYSTDREWLLPHFEKMLYDQALLAMAYTEAFQATGKQIWADAAREIFTYVLRDMTAPEGGFYSAEDADSEGEEGKFYVWTPEEVRAVLGAEEGDLFNRVFDIVAGGNYREQATGQATGASIPHLEQPVTDSDLRARLEAARQRLFEARERRVHPFKDDKILTDWNGLMIAALAKGARALNEPRYAEAARRAADFILSSLRDEHGRLLKSCRQGHAQGQGQLDDYAFMVWGLLELYQTTFDVRYLQGAIQLNETMIRHFRDAENGGFFLTADDGEPLITRPKEIHDGAIPSGNSVAALNLLRLARITASPEMEAMADELMRAFSAQVRQAPAAHTFLLTALDCAVGPSFEVVIAGAPGAADTEAMLRALSSRFLPNAVVLLRPADSESPPIARIAPFTANQTARDGRATAYVCQNQACRAPTTDLAAMINALESRSGAN